MLHLFADGYRTVSNRYRKFFLFEVLKLNALLGLNPFFVGMFDFGHLGDQVGKIDQTLAGVAAGDHHMHGLWFLF